uniref:Reverse transcriptase domain-containing protein n=1 Tax=Timema monikensis TaxID=170555 RepID=A0A7R9HSU6_9NEOP|nr:unnamed protein product [Timema monikensis]
METCDISLVKQEIVELIKTEPQNEYEFDMCGQSGIKTEDESDTTNSVDEIVKTEIKLYDSSFGIMDSNIDHFTTVDKSEGVAYPCNKFFYLTYINMNGRKRNQEFLLLGYWKSDPHGKGKQRLTTRTGDISLVKQEIVELIKTEPQNENEFDTCGQSGIKTESSVVELNSTSALANCATEARSRTNNPTISQRVIHDFSPWMDFNNTLKFSLDTAGITLTKIPHDDWLLKVGLRSGFLQILVSKDTQRFTGIYYRRQKYSATHLSMGHALAPSILQNIAQEVIDYIKELDPSIGGIAYLENFLFHVTNPGTLEHIPEILKSLGFTTNKEKSSPKPLKQPTYLGFKIDTSSST